MRLLRSMRILGNQLVFAGIAGNMPLSANCCTQHYTEYPGLGK